MPRFSGDETDDPIAWLDGFVEITHIVAPESITELFRHQLKNNSPARTWWNDEYVGDRNCWEEIKAAFIDRWYPKQATPTHGRVTILEPHTPSLPAASTHQTTAVQSLEPSTKSKQKSKKKNDTRRVRE
jgi:hypothetical protein